MLESILQMGSKLVSYKDITIKYGAFENAKVQHFRALQGKAAELRQHYEQSLQLPDRSWLDAQNNGHAYVQIGFINDQGKFEECGALSLPCNSAELSVDFAIRLTLEKSPGMFPKAGFVIPINVRRQNQSIRFKVIDAKQEFELTGTNDNEEYEFLCAAMSQLVVNNFDPNIFGMPPVNY